MKEKIIVLFFIIMLTGVVHTLIYSNFLVNIVVAGAYFLGFFGLFSMYESLRYRSMKRRIMVLFFGAVCVLLAFFCLEFLLTQMGRM